MLLYNNNKIFYSLIDYRTEIIYKNLMKFLLSLVENDKALYVVVQNSHLDDDIRFVDAVYVMCDHSSDDGDVLLKIKILSSGMLECLLSFYFKT